MIESRKDLGLRVTTSGAYRGLKTGSAAGGLDNIFNVGVSERRNYFCLLGVSAVVSAGKRNKSFARTGGINYGLDYVVFAEITIGEGLGGLLTAVGAILEVNCGRLTGSR